MAERKYSVAVVGATGLVGRELLETLERRRFPVAELRLFASLNTAGERVSFRDEEARVEPMRAGFSRGCQIVFMAAHPMVSRDLSEQAAAEGSLVIDASNVFRLDPAVPLVVPEINGAEIARARKEKGIVASPSAQAVALALAVAPLAKRFGLARLVVTTVHGTTAAGRAGLDEHQQQTIGIFNQSEMVIEKFPRQCAFNLMPDVGGFAGEDNQAEKELRDELPRILGMDFGIAVTSLLAPVFCGLGAAVNVELGTAGSRAEVLDALAHAPGVTVEDDPAEGEYPDTMRAMEHDEVVVGRLRADPSRERCFQFYLAADNLRKGSSLNLAQIAEAAIQAW